jgi:hypothetical protein
MSEVVGASRSSSLTVEEVSSPEQLSVREGNILIAKSVTKKTNQVIYEMKTTKFAEDEWLCCVPFVPARA